MRLKQSPFLHLVPLDNKYIALYNSLNLEIAFLEKDFLRKHQKNNIWISSDTSSEHVFKSLKQLGILVDEELSGYEQYCEYQKALEKPAINILYLLLTDACNIRCRYCYFLAPMPHDYRFSLMEKETAIKALNLFVRCVEKSVVRAHPEQHIVIYGGRMVISSHYFFVFIIFIPCLINSSALQDFLYAF